MSDDKYSFVYENSNYHKIRIFLFGLFFIFAAIALIIAFREVLWAAAKENNLLQSIIGLIRLEFTELRPGDIFFAGFIGGLFFVFMPLEVMFYSSIQKGSDPFLSIFMILFGFMLSQVINYYVGYKFHPVIMNLVSKKNIYKTRRFINKYGSIGVFLLNLSPLPSEILTFALGIARYDTARLFTFMLLGTFIKYLIIIAIAIWIF